MTLRSMLPKRIITIVIYHLPYRELSPNSREHWAVKARAVKVAKEEVGWLAKAQWQDQEPMQKAEIYYDFRVKQNRHRDLDNLIASCKPWQDGLIEAGVIFYDDAEHLTLGISTVTTDTEDKVFVTIKEA